MRYNEFDLQPMLPRLWYSNPCAKSLFGAIVGGIAAGAAGTLFGRRGGGGGAPPMPELDPRGKEFQKELYTSITSGLEGGGIVPGALEMRRGKLLSATKKAYEETQFDLPGALARFIPKADVGLRDFVNRAIKAQYYRTRQGIKEEAEAEKFGERPLAQSLAFDALAGEKRMGTAITSAYNQSMMRRAMAPDFRSQLFGGLGGAAGIALAGPIGYANMFNELA